MRQAVRLHNQRRRDPSAARSALIVGGFTWAVMWVAMGSAVSLLTGCAGAAASTGAPRAFNELGSAGTASDDATRSAFSTAHTGASEAVAPAADMGKDPLAAGREWMARGDTASAAEAFQHAIQTNPNDPVALNNLAVARAASGDYLAALQLLQQAAANAPGRADIAANLTQFQQWMTAHGTVNLTSPREDEVPMEGDAANTEVPPLWSGEAVVGPGAGLGVVGVSVLPVPVPVLPLSTAR